MLELAARGHSIVVISRYPQSKNITNYVDIDVNNVAPFYNEVVPLDQLGAIPLSLFNNLQMIYR